MSESPAPGGDHISASVGGGFDGLMATGKDIRQTQVVGGAALTAAERAELAAMFEELRSVVAREAPTDLQPRASEHVAELEEALTAEEPDLNTVQYIKRWFTRNLPKLAGSLTALFVHPIVGRLIEAGGDALVSELTSDD